MNRFNLLNVLHSIQEYVKKINSRLSIFDIVGVFLTTLTIVLFSGYITVNQAAATEVSYIQTDTIALSNAFVASDTSLPFASRKGKTYTFTWCSGSSRISAKNKIFFKTEAEALATGRSLSKLCKK